MKLTKLMKEFIELLQAGHKGWFSWTDKRVKCHIYLDADKPDYIRTDKECVSEYQGRGRCISISSSTVAGLLRRGLIEPKTVDILSDRFGNQTFNHYALVS